MSSLSAESAAGLVEAGVRAVTSHPYLVAATVLLILWSIRNANWSGTHGPLGWPIVGNIGWVLKYRNRILDGVLDLSKQYGFTTFTIKWLSEPRYFMIHDPAVVNYVLLENFENYPKGEHFNSTLRDLLGHGIFAADGETWRRQRKVASHMFAFKSFTSNIQGAFIEHGRELEAVLEAAARSGQPIDAQKLFFLFTLDSIAKIAFGVHINALKNPENEFAKAFDEAQATVDSRFFTPGWRLLRWFMPAEMRLRRAVKTMDTFCRDLITTRKAAGDFETRRDVLSRFMSLRISDVTTAPAAGSAAESKAVADAKGPADSDPYAFLHDEAHLRDVVLNFMIAGRDTTAQALSWAVWLIAQHPQVEAAIAREAQALPTQGGDVEAGLSFPSVAITGASRREKHAAPALKSPTGAICAAVAAGELDLPTGDAVFAPSHAAISSGMPYTAAVMRETLRLYPSVPKDMKEAAGPDVLPDGTCVSKGDCVVYLPHAMGRNPQLWGKDAEAFRPERFLGEAPPHKQRLPVFPAFNWGPRTCLGKDMALLEAQFVLALIYRKYSLELVPGQDVTYLDSLTLPQRKGVMVYVRHRRATAGPAASAAAAVAASAGSS